MTKTSNPLPYAKNTSKKSTRSGAVWHICDGKDGAPRCRHGKLSWVRGRLTDIEVFDKEPGMVCLQCKHNYDYLTKSVG